MNIITIIMESRKQLNGNGHLFIVNTHAQYTKLTLSNQNALCYQKYISSAVKKNLYTFQSNFVVVPNIGCCLPVMLILVFHSILFERNIPILFYMEAS